MSEDELTMERMAYWREWNEGRSHSSAHREVQSASGVCVWARTDSPATLHSLAITAPTNNRNFNEVVG